jgi:hypothetical protein
LSRTKGSKNGVRADGSTPVGKPSAILAAVVETRKGLANISTASSEDADDLILKSESEVDLDRITLVDPKGEWAIEYTPNKRYTTLIHRTRYETDQKTWNPHHGKRIALAGSYTGWNPKELFPTTLGRGLQIVAEDMIKAGLDEAKDILQLKAILDNTLLEILKYGDNLEKTMRGEE